jgi:DNA-directed RNA polymerase subunit RPC12/RpoP
MPGKSRTSSRTVKRATVEDGCRKCGGEYRYKGGDPGRDYYRCEDCGDRVRVVE